MIVVTGVNFYKNQVQIRDLEKETAVLDSVLSDEQEEEADTKNTVENEENGLSELSDTNGDIEENIQNGELEEEVQVMETEVEKMAEESELSATTSPNLTITPIPKEDKDVENVKKESKN